MQFLSSAKSKGAIFEALSTDISKNNIVSLEMAVYAAKLSNTTDSKYKVKIVRRSIYPVVDNYQQGHAYVSNRIKCGI